MASTILDILNEITDDSENMSKKVLLPIDNTDTISKLIDKLNTNFDAITETGIFDIKETEIEKEHDKLCDLLLIKPHQPIHRRQKILSPLENRKDISWLKDVDFLIGDIAIVEQERIEDNSLTRVYMYTIVKATGGDYEIALDYETELTGSPGKNGEIFLSSDSKTEFENTFFDDLNVNNLNVNNINLTGQGVLTVPKISTNELTIGDITFSGGDGKSILGSKILNVETIYGFGEPTDNITFGSQVFLNKVSSSEDFDATSFEKPIRVDKLFAVEKKDKNNNPIDDKDLVIDICPHLKSPYGKLILDSPLQLSEILPTDGESIKLPSKIYTNTIESKDYDFIKLDSKLVVNEIISSRENVEGKTHLSINSNVLQLNSTITTTDKLNFDTNVKISYDKELDFNIDNLKFPYFNYSDKFKTHGQIFMGLSNLQNIPKDTSIIEVDNKTDFSKYGIPYSFVPSISNGSDGYFIAKVTYTNEEGNFEKYLLIRRNNGTEEGELTNCYRIFTTFDEKNCNKDYHPNTEELYDIISSSDLYSDIFEKLINVKLDGSNKIAEILPLNNNNITIGLTNNNMFKTICNCTIKIVKIYKIDINLDNMRNLGLTYYMSLY